jgi:hypothetical protein
MSPTWLSLFMPLAPAFLFDGQEAKPQPKAGVGANGMFVGRSGKPMAKMRLILAEVTGDQELTYAKIRLPTNPPIAITDDKGQFQFTSVTPGTYVVLYAPASSSKVLPAENNIKAFSEGCQVALPVVARHPDRRDRRAVSDGPGAEHSRVLKGHTFPAEGPNMKIWNASARFGPGGPKGRHRPPEISGQRSH